jgi:DNA-directed RNA polymerase I, II, and III subunit RPABC2
MSDSDSEQHSENMFDEDILSDNESIQKHQTKSINNNESYDENQNQDIEFSLNVDDEEDNDDDDDDDNDEDVDDMDDEKLQNNIISTPKPTNGGATIVSVPELVSTTQAYSDDSSNYDSDNEEESSEYLQKFDHEIINNHLEQYHPETKMHNFEEVKALSNIVRDVNGSIIDPLHNTVPIMTKYEKTRILGIRANQLNQGAAPFVKISPEILDGYTIALEELKQKKLPFIIRRPIPNGSSEYWRVNDLEIIQ